ncbi:hypothetical protein KBTX_02582 [wastewater metagenome]|uniref:Uncharacterized protein n=2 Tax=unclassified sequences TaxID=12908 RepID=A0A5B8RFD8_9ZZZZ|nr:hypothetical protein KBTEX_02582 [uncultured organism]
MSSRPTSVEPVNENTRTDGCLSRVSEIVPAEPITRFTLPAGRSSSRSSRVNSAIMVSGVFDDGLITLAQSAASAEESFLAIMPMGKFQGVLSATTPAGR